MTDAVPITIQEARDEGAKPGDVLLAPLAPALGPITVGVGEVVRASDGKAAQEPLVVVAVRAFWDSPTIIWLRRLVFAAFGVAFVAVIEPYTLGGKTWAEFSLQAAWSPFLHAFEAAILAAVFAYLKVQDNNPIQSLKGVKP